MLSTQLFGVRFFDNVSTILRVTSRTLLLFYLVVDIISIPVDPASGELTRCSEIFPGLIILENPIYHFEKTYSGRHRTETSSVVFYFVQKKATLSIPIL